MTKDWEKDLLELLKNYEGRLPDSAVMSIVSALLAKQRTKLLARVREEVIKTKRKKAIWLDAIWYNEAIDDILKKLEIISEEVK